MTPTPNHLADSFLYQESKIESIKPISIPDAITLLEGLTGKVTTLEGIQLMTSLRTKLLRLEETGVHSVTGALEIMLSELKPQGISLAQATGILTRRPDGENHPAANDDRFNIAA